MRLLWEESAWEDYCYWQTQDRKTLNRILQRALLIFTNFFFLNQDNVTAIIISTYNISAPQYLHSFSKPMRRVFDAPQFLH